MAAPMRSACVGVSRAATVLLVPVLLALAAPPAAISGFRAPGIRNPTPATPSSLMGRNPGRFFGAAHRPHSTAPAFQRPAGKARVENGAGVWSRIPPPTLDQAGSAYDILRQRLLVFGGSENDSVTDQLWELRLTGTPTWTRLQTTGTGPVPRQAHSLLYDVGHDRLILFGGANDSSQTLNDVWELPLSIVPLAWNQLVPTGTPPSPRGYTSATYDTTGDRVILFGGAQAVSDTGPPSNFVNDVWALSLGALPTWTPLVAVGTAPSARAGAQMILDRGRNRAVVYGGFDGATLGDAFTLSLGAIPGWAALTPTGGPPPARAVAVTVYDPPNDQMVVYAGVGGNGDVNLSDAWSLALGAEAWTELVPTGGPPSPRQFPIGAYDVQRRQMVTYAGRDTFGGQVGDVAWGLSLNGSPQWTVITDGPSGRYQSAGIYDPIRNRLVIYGGFDGNSWLSDTWTLSLNLDPRWTRLALSGQSPGMRTGHSTIYDRLRDRLILFGGNFGMAQFNDVWELTLGATPEWTELFPSGTPPSPRTTHSAFYDARRDRMLVFGGGALGNETWSLDLATTSWTELEDGSTAPQGGTLPAVTYDELNNQILVFTNSGITDEQWTLSLSGTPTWSHITAPDPHPLGRYGAVAVYDTLAKAMLVSLGNGNTSGPLNATWALLQNSGPTWLPIDVGPETPNGRTQAVGVYDQAGARLVAFSGTQFGFQQHSDTWVLTVDRATPVLASLVSKTSRPDRIEIIWQLARPTTGVVIERRELDQAWQPVAHRDADGTGRLLFVDADVIPGHRYAYRLGIPDGSGITMTPEEWVEVPSAATLALVGLVPNPAFSSAGANLNFSLPNAGPAHIEVLDIGGRRILAREVGTLGPGKHAVSLRGSRMPPGLYVVRLVSSGRVMERRAVVLK